MGVEIKSKSGKLIGEISDSGETVLLIDNVAVKLSDIYADTKLKDKFNTNLKTINIEDTK